ncbi:MAG: hypothetical protein RL141_704 [Candidatus Parcubacteria bacterium]|jgi:hypothetical protein
MESSTVLEWKEVFKPFADAGAVGVTPQTRPHYAPRWRYAGRDPSGVTLLYKRFERLAFVRTV